MSKFQKAKQNLPDHKIALLLWLEQPWCAEKSQNPTALEAIKAFEAGKAALPEEVILDDKFNVPTFTKHINDIVCDEEANVRFECALEPKNDPSMKIGKLLGLEF